MAVSDPPVRSLPSHVAAFMDLMSSFPAGVVVVTTVSPEGILYGMTCSSMVSVTLAPPTLLVSLRSSSPTLEAIRQRGCFAVNLLNVDGVYAARLFSSPTPSRFSRIAWKASPVMRLPWLIEHAFAYVDCRLAETYPVGDHMLTIGHVTIIHQSAGQPLLYGQRRYSAFSCHDIR
jgi:flavin reductase (DIM6/NTAB) family NADH-FMN oxidoreductase RutF